MKDYIRAKIPRYNILARDFLREVAQRADAVANSQEKRGDVIYFRLIFIEADEYEQFGKNSLNIINNFIDERAFYKVYKENPQVIQNEFCNQVIYNEA